MAEEQDFRVAVLPCNGIGRVASTVVRRAGYRIKEMRPKEVELLSCGRLAVMDPEELERLRRHPLLVIDGCRPHCASFLADELGRKPAAKLYVADVAAARRISVSGEKRRGLQEKGRQLAEALAEEAVKEIDRIIADEMLSTL